MRRGYDVSGTGTSSSHPHARLCSGLRFHGRNRSTSSTAQASGLGTRFQVRRQPRTRIQLPQTQRLQQREHHRRPTTAPYRTRTVVVLPTHHGPTLFTRSGRCCCPSAPRGARQTRSSPSSDFPSSPRPAARAGCRSGAANSASPRAPKAVTARRRRRAVGRRASGRVIAPPSRR